MLGRLGFEAVGAESGEQALALLPDIGDSLTAVVLDLTMPGMSGDETFHALRTRHPDLPVLCCSGHGAATGSDWLKQKRRVDFVAKPFQLQELGQAIASLVDR